MACTLSQISRGGRKFYNAKRMYYRTDIAFITKLESNENREFFCSATVFFCQLRGDIIKKCYITVKKFQYLAIVHFNSNNNKLVNSVSLKNKRQ